MGSRGIVNRGAPIAVFVFVLLWIGMPLDASSMHVSASVGGVLAPPPPPDTTPPVANAGPDQLVDEDTPVTFDGSGSTDNVGIVNYSWMLVGQAGAVRPVLNVSTGGAQAVFDPVRPYLYILDGQQHVYFVNLTTGSVDKTFTIDHAPQYALSIAVAPRGTYLVVGIPTGSRGYYDFGPYESYFATFDLIGQTKIGEFFVNEDVYRVLVTSDGYVIIAGGSGQWAGLRMFDANNGTEYPPQNIIWQYSAVAMHPSEHRLYSVDESGLSPARVVRYDFVPGGGFGGTMWWPHHGQYYPGQQVWASPAGDRLLTGSGLLLVSDDNASLDMYLQKDFGPMTIVAAAFDRDLSLLAAAEYGMVHFFDPYMYEDLGTVDLGRSPFALTFRGTDLLAFLGDSVVAVQVPRILLYHVQASHVFPDPGTFVVTLTVRDAAGNVDNDTANVTVRDVTAPTVNAGPDQRVIRGTTVTLAAWNATDNVGIAQYIWTFDDNGPQTLDGNVATYAFRNLGSFVVTLTARDAAGNAGTDTTTVVVERDLVAPVAFAGSDQRVFKGTTVRFSGSGSTDNVEIVSYEWTFSDGGPQLLTGVNATHRFGTPGSYEVTLTVRDAEGNLGSDRMTLVVEDIPLKEYVSAAAHFRISVPTFWNVQLATTVGSLGYADLVAYGPMLNGTPTSIIVLSEAANALVSDQYLLARAQDALGGIRSSRPDAVVRQGPEIAELAHARAAVFTVMYPPEGAVQEWAIFGSESRQRLWLVVGTVSAASLEVYGPVFNATIGSFAIDEPGWVERSALLIGLTTTFAGAGAAGAAAWVFMRRRPPVDEPGVSAPTSRSDDRAAWRIGSPAAAATAVPSACPSCGRPILTSYRFCIFCGRPLA